MTFSTGLFWKDPQRAGGEQVSCHGPPKYADPDCVPVAQLSDDELPHLSSSFAGASRNSMDPINGADILTSSPPPIAADLPPPETE